MRGRSKPGDIERCTTFYDFVTLTIIMKNLLSEIREMKTSDKDYMQRIAELKDVIHKQNEFLQIHSNNVEKIERILQYFKNIGQEAERSELIQKVKLSIQGSDHTDKAELCSLMSKIDQFLKPFDQADRNFEDCVLAVEGRMCSAETVEKIGKVQNITDLWVLYVNTECLYMYKNIFYLSENAKSVCFYDCILSRADVKDLCVEIGKCQKLTHLQLIDNKHSFQGDIMGKIITSDRPDPPLEVLNLRMLLMPESACLLLTSTLANYKHLTHWDWSRNHLGQAGRNLAQSISPWGDESHLKMLCLESCAIPDAVWPDVLKSLCTSKLLSCLRLSENCLTGNWHVFSQ